MGTPTVVIDREVWIGGWDLTAQHLANAEAAETEQLDATVYKQNTKLMDPGLKGYGLSGEAFWEGGDDAIDDVLFDQQRVKNLACSLALTDGSVGSRARTLEANIAAYEFGEQYGQLLKVSYSLGVTSSRSGGPTKGPLLGFILHNAQASGNVTGTALELGAVTASQYLYGVLHVFSGSGDLDVVIQSDDAEGMSTPTTRLTFSQVGTATARSYEFATPVAGAITDTWWRISATNPATRDFAVVAAIR